MIGVVYSIGIQFSVELAIHRVAAERDLELAKLAVEALIRWIHPVRGLLSPVEFMEIAEETGLVVPIGRWVLRQACRQWRVLRDAGMTSLRMSINVSGAQLRDPSLAPAFHDFLQNLHCNLIGLI